MAALLFVSAALAWCQGDQRLVPRPTDPIRTAAAVHAMSAEMASKGLPVALHGTVSFYDPNNGPQKAALFLTDSSGAVYVSLPGRPVLPLREGTEVEVTGITVAGDFAASVAEGKVRVTGQSTPETGGHPRLPRVSLNELQTGADDCMWVEVVGVVHSIRVGQHNVVYHISTNEGAIQVMQLKQDGIDYMKYLDALVAIRGASAVDYNLQRQMTGVHLFSQSVGDITVLRAGGGDPFGTAVRPIASLSQFDPKVTQFVRIHLRGKVTLDWPSHEICLEEASGGVCILSETTQTPAVGSMVDVSGFTAFGARNPGLKDAMFRGDGPGDGRADTFGGGPATVARVVDVPTALYGSTLGKLVSVDGELVGVNRAGTEWQLTLEANGIVFTAVIPKDGIEVDESKWRVGSRIRVIGVCDNVAAQGQSWISEQQFDSFRILMRTPDDVTVLRSPSWWSKTHTVASLSGALATIITVLGWVVLLRRRVEQKTRELRSSEERYRNLAEHDPLTGAPNRALFRDRMRIALERAKRQGLRVGLLLLDLDRFKPINDELGHEAGDRVLCALVDRASSAVRKSDTVARLGGDEFAVLVPDLDTAEEALMVAEKILRAVCQPLAVSEREVAVSTSLGVAVYPDDGASLEELLRNADAAMYQSKKQGRGGMERYQPEPVETTIKGDVGLVAAVVSQRG